MSVIQSMVTHVPLVSFKCHSCTDRATGGIISRMKVERLEGGVAICGDSTSSEVIDQIRVELADEPLKLVATDPPYGNVVDESWDKWSDTQRSFTDWMVGWTNTYTDLLTTGGAMYVWGGWGIDGFRPFFEYASRIERESSLKIANFITWSKRRAYGVQHNYLSTREDMIYMVKGNPKRPATFNIPLLDTKRGYAGYDTKYPAKSEFYRRTSVWTDITEIMSGKVHPTQKALRVVEIPIEVNTNPGDWVVDPFAGSMTTAHAACKLGRRWICVERDEKIFDAAIAELKDGARKR